MDIKKLSSEFLSIDEEMSDLIYKSNSLATEGVGKESWERYKELEQIRRNKVKELFVDNNSDDMCDYVHDAILCDDKDIPMPIGYLATVIASYHNSLTRVYDTIVIVETPQDSEYLICVPTFNKITIGTIFCNK